MDLIGAITGLNQASVMSQIQMRVARKILDMQQSQGSAAVKLIESADKNVTQAADTLAAAATGMGGNLDVYA